jgi:hypothetical protein
MTDRQIAQRKLGSLEIGERLGVACRSFERTLERIRKTWEGELEK